MITSDQEYFQWAIKSYDNPSAITIDDFTKDLSHISTIKKAVRKYRSDNSHLRRLVNQVVIFYNVFGITGTELLMYKVIEDDILECLIPIILYLGRSTTTIDNKRIELNIDIIKQLNEL